MVSSKSEELCEAMSSGDGATALSQSQVTVSSMDPTTAAEDGLLMSYKRRYITVAVLSLINLLNYMDRYTIAGVLTDVQNTYKIGDGDAGLLQAMFIVGFTVTAPAFGYAGDRFNRKWLMIGGIGLWSVVTFAGSFVPGNLFWLFLLLRGIVGVGEASYVTIAPTLISDMFVKELRSSMLMVFYFAIPAGSGLGYIVGSNVAKLAGNDWRYALRVTPGLGILCCLLIAIVTQDPPRGMAEDGASHHSNSSMKEDLKALVKNKSFVLSSAGNTCVTFVSGALALFAPKFLLDAARVSGDADIQQDQVSLYMGIITTAAGFIGVALGTEVAKRVKRVHRNGDPIVCAFGLIASMPFLFAGLVVCEYNMIATWILVFIGETLVFMNWPLVADMLLYTVSATRRSTAEAVQLFGCHLLGDAASPYLIGLMSDGLKGSSTDIYVGFKSLQHSLFITLFITILGGGFFLFCSLYIAKDKAKAEAATRATASREPPRIYRESQQTLPLDDMLPLLDEEMLDVDSLTEEDVNILPT